MSKRILVCEFRQESNTFNPVPCAMPVFSRRRFAEGQQAYAIAKSAPSDSGGIIDAIEAAGGEVVFAVTLCAGAGGKVTDDVLDCFLEKVHRCWETEGPFDAVCLSLHGATTTDSVDDPCGKILTELRELIGPDMLMTAAFDLHANMTDQMLAAANLVCGYQCYPHTDIYETGYRSCGCWPVKSSIWRQHRSRC